MILAAIRAEWFKVVRRPSMWLTIGLMLAISVSLEYFLVYVVVTHPPPNAVRVGATLTTLRNDLYPAALVRKTLANMSGLYGIFALIIGVLVQGSEYSWGAVKTTHLQLPGRVTIAGGQLVALAVLALVMALGLYAVGGAASFGLATIDGQSTAWPPVADLIKGIGAAWLILYFMSVVGFGLATLLKGSAVAIGFGLAYVLVIENLVFGLLVNLGDTFKRIQELFPVANAGYLEQSFGALRGAAASTESSPPVDATHAVTVIVIWLVAIAAISAGLMRIRDIT